MDEKERAELQQHLETFMWEVLRTVDLQAQSLAVLADLLKRLGVREGDKP
jgi:hypothetical protein